MNWPEIHDQGAYFVLGRRRERAETERKWRQQRQCSCLDTVHLCQCHVSSGEVKSLLEAQKA